MTSGTKINRPRIGILCLQRSTFWDAVCDMTGMDSVPRKDIIGTDDRIFHMISNRDTMRGQYFDEMHDLLQWDSADGPIAESIRELAKHRLKNQKP
mgnify:CR=1 FL=1